jgi:hypothetical protein
MTDTAYTGRNARGAEVLPYCLSSLTVSILTEAPPLEILDRLATLLALTLTVDSDEYRDVVHAWSEASKETATATVAARWEV